MITFFILVLLLYCFTFLWLFFYALKIKKISNIYEARFTFSILIPFRNEGENILNLLKSIEKIKYDFTKFEVILIDDNENEFLIDTDEYSFKIIKIPNKRTTNSPKKDALTLGVQQANFNYIITVDADCEVPQNWLQNYNNYLTENIDKELVIGQVEIKNNYSFLQIFQSIEFDVLQALTQGSYAINQAFMCNGANLCFSKKMFSQLNGYQGNTNISSGDDVFLLQKVMQKNPKLVGFCKSNEKVVTNAVTTWKSIWNQRLRWASKTKAYQSYFAKYLAILVFFTQFITLLTWSYLLTINWNKMLFLILILKYLVHLLLLFSIQKFKIKPLIYSILFELYYTIFTLLLSFVSLSNPKIKWKN
jgi:cellulose synthase/poly-beta-1,6-N-acetylglucosamine synthase-like glycosyltransferase